MLDKIKNKFKNIIPFLKEVRLEVKKINWPSRKETLRYTFIVVAVSALAAAFLGGLDYVFSQLVNKVIF